MPSNTPKKIRLGSNRHREKLSDDGTYRHSPPGSLRYRSPRELDPSSVNAKKSPSKPKFSFSSPKLKLFSGRSRSKAYELPSDDEDTAELRRPRTESYGRSTRRKKDEPLLPSPLPQDWSAHEPDPSFQPVTFQIEDSSESTLHRVITNATQACHLWNPSVRDLVTTETASAHNSYGQTPLHVLSDNVDLSSAIMESDGSRDEDEDLRILPTNSDLTVNNNDPSERQVVHFGLHLVRAYPVALITHDRHGFIPFERACKYNTLPTTY